MIFKVTDKQGMALHYDLYEFIAMLNQKYPPTKFEVQEDRTIIKPDKVKHYPDGTTKAIYTIPKESDINCIYCGRLNQYEVCIICKNKIELDIPIIRDQTKEVVWGIPSKQMLREEKLRACREMIKWLTQGPTLTIEEFKEMITHTRVRKKHQNKQ